MRPLVAAALMFSSLAACGGKKSAPVSPTGNTGGDVIGPPYAALFEDGRTFRYKRVHETSYYEPDDPDAGGDGNVLERSEREVTCTVAAKTFATVKVAKLTCTPDAADDNLITDLTSIFVTDERGIFRSDATAHDGLPVDEDSAKALIDEQTRPLLAATPKPEEERKEEEEGFGEMRKVSQGADDAWCVEWGSWGGDEGGGSICFGAARGITKVSSYFAGGSTQDDWFELVK